MVTHDDLLVALVFSIAVGATTTVFSALVLYRLRRTAARSEELTRALAGLVMQETRKLRNAIRG